MEFARADLTVPESLDPALNGVHSVFLVWTAPPATVEPVVARIARQARSIVFLSAPLKTPHPLFQQPNRGRALGEKIEQSIERSGLAWTFLRPGMFAANALGWWGSQIRAGDVVRWPCLDVPTAPIHEKDIAAVAVRALTGEGHDRAEYVLTGPQSLSQFEQVSAIGRAIGRPLRIEESSPEEWRREQSATWPPAVVEMLLDAWSAARGRPAWVTSTVAEMTGTPARSFFEWAVEHAAEFFRPAAADQPI